MKRSRKRPTVLSVSALECRQLLSGNVSGVWKGQDGHDLVGPSWVVAPSDVQDIHIALSGLPTDRIVTFGSIRPLGGGEWQYQGASGGPAAAALVRVPGSSSADLYLEPYQSNNGLPYEIFLRYDDGSSYSFWVSGGPVDPNLRMPHAALQVAWAGQDGSDQAGHGPAVGPDGFQDVHLILSNLSAEIGVESIIVGGPPGVSWRYGTNREALTNAEMIRRTNDPSVADLYLAPDRNLDSQFLTVDLTYTNGKSDHATVLAGPTQPDLPVSPAPAIPTFRVGLSATWLGQDGLDLTAKGDVHLTLTGLPAGRTVVGAMLNDAADQSWVYRKAGSPPIASDPYAPALGFRRSTADATRADVTFAPIRDEGGSVLTVRLVFDDGTMALAQVSGGTVDLGLRSPNTASTSVTAHPGDDLNDLASRFGSVHLTVGTYRLDQPLVLPRPISITADPGTVLLFSQPATSAPWATAIKIQAGHTTLNGFAVRFDGPVRWNQGVNYGPAVIGTTDNTDGIPNAIKTAITLTRLDIESPPVPSGWEEAPRLMRLVTAQSGTIVGNVLKGGPIEVIGGPWTIAGNNVRGTVPNTYSSGVIAAHDSHDLRIENNHVEPQSSAGVTWRFLVMTNAGYNDVIRNNTVIGLGSKPGDNIPDANAAEIILTEGYRIHFEGTPLAISSDGRILQIPRPQGGAAQTGDAVAILDGPDAGQWRRIAQVIDDQTYLLESPLPAGRYTISIAEGFVNTTFQGNTIDSSGSTAAGNLILVGNHFGTKVIDNHLIGGRESFKIAAAPTESPIMWGWSHAPFMGGVISGNTFENALVGGTISVERGSTVKSSKGRVYLSGTFSDNRFVYSADVLAQMPDPVVLTVGDLASLDPDEQTLTFRDNLANVPLGTSTDRLIRVNAGRINGTSYVDARLGLPPAEPPPILAGFGLANDTGRSASDAITSDGRLQFHAWSGAAGYEYRVGTTGAYRALGLQTTFLPVGLVQGSNTVSVRSIDAWGQRGPAATMTFVFDNVPPPALPTALKPASDTGASSSDRITATRQPEFQAEGDTGDLLVLLRDGRPVAQRMGSGSLMDPGVPSDGVFRYRIQRTDAAGNSSLGPDVAVTIDTTPPAPVGGLTLQSNGQATFQPTSATDVYEYRVGSTPFRSLGSATAFTPQGLEFGANLVEVRAIDLAGNHGSTSFLVVQNVPPVPTGVWKGQDGADYVGMGPTSLPDGSQDIHIAIGGLPANKAIVSASVEPLGGGQWLYNGPYGPWKAALFKASGATNADLYIQPYQRETGRPFWVSLRLNDGTTTGFWVKGGSADPGIKVAPGSPVPSGTIQSGYRAPWSSSLLSGTFLANRQALWRRLPRAGRWLFPIFRARR